MYLFNVIKALQYDPRLYSEQPMIKHKVVVRGFCKQTSSVLHYCYFTIYYKGQARYVISRFIGSKLYQVQLTQINVEIKYYTILSMTDLHAKAKEAQCLLVRRQALFFRGPV